MFKKILCFSLLLVFFCLPLNVLAANEVRFSLADVSTEKNRLFETTLSANSEVAAFVATLTFDENVLEFREAKALSDTAEISVNNSESGSVIIAYLCKEGTKGELIAFTFKAKDESTHIALSLEQVIDKSAADLSVSSQKSASVTVLSKITQKDKTKETKDDLSEADSLASDTNTTLQNSNESIEVKAEKGVDVNLVTSIICTAFVIFAVAGVAFVLGKKSGKNK